MKNLNSKQFSWNKETKTAVAELSELGNVYLNSLRVASAKTLKVFTFMLIRVVKNSDETQAYEYKSANLPGWTLVVLND